MRDVQGRNLVHCKPAGRSHMQRFHAESQAQHGKTTTATNDICCNDRTPSALCRRCRRHRREVHDGPLAFDLGNLLAWDASAVDAAALTANGIDPTCQRLAQSIFQSLAARLFSLPSEAVAVGRVAELPRPATVLPREKPIPKPRPPTKWEQFAQRKGIEKQKRSKVEWDESSQEWRRRYGYKRVNDETEVAVIEAKPGDLVRQCICRASRDRQPGMRHSALP